MAMVQITLTRGMSGHAGPRRMTGVGGFVAYELFLDAARTSIWGDGTAGSQVFAAAIGMGQTLRLPVYGRIFPYQAAPAGVYTDTIEVIVVF
jgi:spore coat protein U-like protein